MLRGDQDINVGRKDDHLPGSHLYARKEAATSFHNLVGIESFYLISANAKYSADVAIVRDHGCRT